MAGRKKAVAQTVTEIADAVSGATFAALTRDQRALLSSQDTGDIVKASIDFAVLIGSLIEERASGKTPAAGESKRG